MGENELNDSVATVESTPVEDSEKNENIVETESEEVEVPEESEEETIGGEEDDEPEQTQASEETYVEDNLFVDEDGESESDEDSEDQNDPEKGEEQKDASVNPTPAPEQNTEKPAIAETSNGEDSEFNAAIQARIESDIKEDYIPNTKAFRDGVRNEAKQAVIDELGVEDYDPYDDEHQMLFLEKAQQISARRVKAYQLNVERFEREYRHNQFTNNLQQKMNKIIDTPEKSKALDDALGGMSVNAYRKLQMEIQSGNSDNLIRLANAVVSKMNGGKGIVPKPKPSVHHHNEKPAKKERSDKYVSDFFGW